ncbi:hypothetical protein [Nonomuraea sp. SBT364]|uniref:hypothetical protein n=1 Tax=Nonomuraea sp. SBT364 TaxID=1580530 RepID=UPI00066A619B|nr:hypothetical protein [Nonomuraea sp. SBT364]
MDASVARLTGLLRPGGKLVVTAWAQGAVEGFGRLLAEAVARVREAPAPPPSSKQAASRLDSEERLAAWLIARGLTEVKVTRAPLRLPLDAALAWQVALGSGFRGMLAGLEEPVVERVRTTLAQLLDERKMAELDATSLVGAGMRP